MQLIIGLYDLDGNQLFADYTPAMMRKGKSKRIAGSTNTLEMFYEESEEQYLKRVATKLLENLPQYGSKIE
ncbi:MAG: hypothetical protein KZQ83_18975 [gamma proteobacterium symbiont of Taylorina sp.]|nr:hypothetical protein [gamma proteobacterium symbiont of Taylorina sp.]